jgi:uncharacterized protein Yka (UPF0111/DUF47 family)
MDNSRKIVAICEEIDRLESDADHVMRAAMSKLFRDEPDVRNLIKLKAIYEILETVTDRCEDVANIIEGIIVENASLSKESKEHINPTNQHLCAGPADCPGAAV